MAKEYIKKDGKVYEVTGRDAQKRKTVKLIPGLKDIPVEKKVEVEETAVEDIPLKELRETPKRSRRKK